MTNGKIYDIRNVLWKIAQNEEKLRNSTDIYIEFIMLKKKYSDNLNRIVKRETKHDLERTEEILGRIQERLDEYGYQ